MGTAKAMYMHIGLPKTGTSSIQLVLQERAAMLAEQGVVYPRDIQGIANHRTFVTAIGGRRIARVTNLDVAKCQASVAETIAAFRSDADTTAIVWSHESLAGCVDRWEFRFLEELAAGLDIKVILYVRYTSDWMESQYRQLLWGQSLRPMESISREELLDIRRLCERWLRNIDATSICGKIEKRLPHAEILLRSFDADRQHQLLPSFFNMIGANLPVQHYEAHAASYRTNATRPGIDTALLHAVWRGGIDSATITLLARTLEKTARSAAVQNEGLQLQLVPQDCADTARLAYAAVCAQFPQLPCQPGATEALTSATELRDRMIARLEAVRARLDKVTFDRVLSAVREA
jgi:hypothetical protein